MSPGAFFSLLFAHFFADFPLQFNSIIKMRYSNDRKVSLLGNALHGCVHFIVSIISISYFLSWKMVFIVLAITLAHMILDFIKSAIIIKHPFWKYSIGIFLADQSAHLFCIFLSFTMLSAAPAGLPPLVTMKDNLLVIAGISFDSVTYAQKLILALALLAAGLWGVGAFIRLVLNKMVLMPYKDAINLKLELINLNKNEGAADGGYIIGILERFFIIVSMVFDMPLVIGFILTVKSVARLKKFDDERFAEIFIIGSFISFISAIVTGYCIKALHIIPYCI